MNKVVIITGGSSGIGICTAAALRDRGCKVYELSRRESEVEGITHLKCDITDESQIAAAVEQVMAENGRIDILINNAGFGISGAVNHVTGVDAEKFVAVNRDPDAPIFNYCDYGIVGDMDEVCDAMLEALKAK